MIIPLHIRETYGMGRVNEPITMSIPFHRGTVFNERNIFLFDDKGNALDLQVKVLAQWPDQSIKWLLCDCQVSVEAKTETAYQVLVDTQRERPDLKSGIKLVKHPNSLIVNTGITEFQLDDRELKLFSKVATSGFTLTDDKGKVFIPKINNIDIETEGCLRTTLKISGGFLSRSNEFFAKYVARLFFYANKNFVKYEFTLHNQRKAGHKGGFWDLGARGSIFFKDLSFCLELADKGSCEIKWSLEVGENCLKTAKPLRIYQDSSGGENWRSSNHCNRNGRVMNSFCGYKVYEDGNVITEGKKAEFVASVTSGNKKVSAVLKDFWQNFPKSIETEGCSLILRLFPKYYQDVFELQGGEQKTHTFYIDFVNTDLNTLGLEWANKPLYPYLDSLLYSESNVFGYLTLPQGDPNPEYKALVNSAVEGNDTFFHKREVIDDYGWRHFGCLYADHEAVKSKNKEPLISHYNNQYDVIQGLILQFARTGDFRWFSLSEPLAYHTVDIDMYHTDKDKSAYNGGLFWHTEHYIDARTSTHRTYSRNLIGDRVKKYCGGGPANEHNYTTGLLNMYFLTGNVFFKEAVIGLANWVINMDDGSKTIFRFLDKSPTGLASQSASEDYHGPGRGSGNSLNALIDAHILTKDKKYILKAEELIRRCVHPKSDIKAQKLDEPEIRWFYLVFLQALSKYLDYKVELGEIDYMYHYSRESLLHYARWIYENEKLYKFVKDKLLIWTETWPAQDIRKSVVFDYAAKYSLGTERAKFLEKSEYFYNGSIEELSSFVTKSLSRPVVLMMHFGVMHGYFLKHINDFQPITTHSYDFGKPQVFIPQKLRVKRKILCQSK